MKIKTIGKKALGIAKGIKETVTSPKAREVYRETWDIGKGAISFGAAAGEREHKRYRSELRQSRKPRRVRMTAEFDLMTPMSMPSIFNPTLRIARAQPRRTAKKKRKK